MRSTEEFVETLRAALAATGITLPSLTVDPVSAATGEPFALVDLGRCNVRNAERLASVFRGERRPVGTHARDARDGRIGEVMGHVGGNAQLRPLGGGREWECPPGAIEPVGREEVLREQVRARNRQVSRP